MAIFHVGVHLFQGQYNFEYPAISFSGGCRYASSPMVDGYWGATLRASSADGGHGIRRWPSIEKKSAEAGKL